MTNFPSFAPDPDRARTVRIGCQKGGTGRTTTVVNAAYELARIGARVLLIDADANRQLTRLQMGFEPDPDTATIETMLTTTTQGAAAEMLLAAPAPWQPRHDLPYEHGGAAPGTDGAIAFIPGVPSIGATVDSMGSLMASEQRMANALRGVATGVGFDLVLIDAGPIATRLAWMTVLAAAHAVTVALPSDTSNLGMEDEVDFVHGCGASFGVPVRHHGSQIVRYSQQSRVVHGEALRRLEGTLRQQAELNEAFQPINREAVTNHTSAWVSGPRLWPELIPQRSTIEKMVHNNQPLGSLLADLPGAAFFQQSEIRELLPVIDMYRTVGLRLLQVTDADRFSTIQASANEHPLIEGDSDE